MDYQTFFKGIVCLTQTYVFYELSSVSFIIFTSGRSDGHNTKDLVIPMLQDVKELLT